MAKDSKIWVSKRNVNFHVPGIGVVRAEKNKEIPKEILDYFTKEKINFEANGFVKIAPELAE